MSVQDRDLHDHFQARVSKVEDGEGEEESFKEIYEGNLHELREEEVVRGQVVQVGPE